MPQRLEALERLFETRPDLRGEFTYIQKGCVTRERIPAYQRLGERIEGKIHSLNDRFGTSDWSPVVYTTKMFDRDVLLSLYRHSDMAIVGPLRDGMNLVAKEYVASQIDNDGVLLLSPFAGAVDQLGESALKFDPHDTANATDALARAVEMREREQRRRMLDLRYEVHEKDLSVPGTSQSNERITAVSGFRRNTRTHRNEPRRCNDDSREQEVASEVGRRPVYYDSYRKRSLTGGPPRICRHRRPQLRRQPRPRMARLGWPTDDDGDE